MSFNPLERFVEHRARKAADEVYSKGHWGTHYSFPVQWSGRHPLVFEIRAPDGVELVDAVTLAKDARGAQAWIGDALHGLDEAVRMPGESAR